MGCVSSKGANRDGSPVSQRPIASRKSLNRLRSSSRSKETGVVDVNANVGSTARFISKSRKNTVHPPPLLSGSGEKLLVIERSVKAPPLLVGDGEKKVFPAVEVTGEGARKQRLLTPDAWADVVQTASAVVIKRAVEEQNMAISHVPNGFKFEHVVAGWPYWLTAVAGEAVKGWLPRRVDSFEKLNMIGQGTYSDVYRARDLETGKTVALKKVRFDNLDPESVRFMAREINILRRLDHPNVVKLEALVASKMSSSLYLVFEYMEHDLAGLVANPGVKFTELQVSALIKNTGYGVAFLLFIYFLVSFWIMSSRSSAICTNYSVVLNIAIVMGCCTANLLIDNSGILKIADFGLATVYNSDKKQHLTSRVVTLWYRPPELLLGTTEYDVAVDMWSTGCILAELLTRRPIMPGRTEVEQLHKIFKLCGSPSEEFWRTSKLPNAISFRPQQPYPRCVKETFKDLPPPALALLDRLLSIDPTMRGSANSSLKSEFFTTKPFACNPSSLPKYPPSKEYDAKLRNEEARRQREATTKANESRKETHAPVGNMESQTHNLHGSLKTSIKYKPKEEALTGYRKEPPREAARDGFSYGGPSMHSGRLSITGQPVGTGTKNHSPCVPHGNATAISTGLSVTRSNTARLHRRQSAKHINVPEKQLDLHNQLASDSSEKQVWTHHLDEPLPSQKIQYKQGEDELTYVNSNKKNRIHYSGPLMLPKRNFEELLKEHEREIQQTVRRARHDRAKAKKYSERAQFEALLYANWNGRSDH